jgi:hypothetical protein
MSTHSAKDHLCVGSGTLGNIARAGGLFALTKRQENGLGMR